MRQPSEPASKGTSRNEDMRCRRCGYPLRGLDRRRCPECGTLFDPSDRRTFSSGQISGRRYFRWTLGALLLYLLVFVSVSVSIPELLAVIPGDVLIAVLSVLAVAMTLLFGVLAARSIALLLQQDVFVEEKTALKLAIVTSVLAFLASVMLILLNLP